LLETAARLLPGNEERDAMAHALPQLSDL